ncbi:MAG: MerR family transcriptional regulator [Muribaculaceae bacterium]|nr:MerR family transcriptional regulator [Muribaculaceae bacterium]
MEEFSKKYYKIGEVAELLNVPASTLRFWEKQFTIIRPKRNAGNTRFYTPEDVEVIRMIYYLVKEKGLKLDAAQQQIKINRKNVSQRSEVINRLKDVRAQLQSMLDVINAIR